METDLAGKPPRPQLTLFPAMSLFRMIDKDTHLIQDATCFTFGNFYEDREQMLVGSEHGHLAIIDTGGAEKKDSLILDNEISAQIIQLEVGEFLPAMGNVVAVLSTKKLVFYKISFEGEENADAKVQEIFAHELQEEPYNMCLVQSFDNLQILVQSLSCNLTLFQGDQCVFSKLPLKSIQPGPIFYSLPSSSLITANNSLLCSVKFSLLNSVSTSSKKITYDWTFNLGDMALEVDVEDRGSVQPAIVVLCRRSLYCMTIGGTVRWQIRFECPATAMQMYHSPSSEENHIRVVIATTDNNLLIYKDEKLVWNCCTYHNVIGIGVNTFSNMWQNMICLITDDGKVKVGYLGTEPSLYKAPIDTRIINYEEKRKMLNDYMRQIKKCSGTDSEATTNSDFYIELSCSEIGKPSIEHNSKSGVPSCELTIKFRGVSPGTNKIQINLSSDVATPSKQILFDLKAGNELILPFYIGNNAPTDNKVTIATHCLPMQASSIQSINLPFDLLFKEGSPDRNAKHKLTIDCDKDVIPINILFADFQIENPQAIGFQLHGYDVSVSIFAANKSNRYRVQSEHMEHLHVVTKELTKRLIAKGIKVTAVLPMEFVPGILETIQKHDAELVEAKKRVEGRMKEVRSIEALLLSKTKRTNMEPVDHIDALLEKSHRELLHHIDKGIAAEKAVDAQINILGSIFQLFHDFSTFQTFNTVIDGRFWRCTDQSLKDRLMWLSGAHRAGEMIQLIEVAVEVVKKTPPEVATEPVEKEQI